MEPLETQHVHIKENFQGSKTRAAEGLSGDKIQLALQRRTEALRLQTCKVMHKASDRCARSRTKSCTARYVRCHEEEYARYLLWRKTQP